MRTLSLRRTVLPVLLALTLSLGLMVAAVSAGTMLSSAKSGPAPADKPGSDLMLANYVGGNTIDKEIREKRPRADGYYHVDTKRTISELKKLNANTHYFLMWHSPSDWQDFTEEFLPAAQHAGIDVWAYIVPPSECHTGGWCSEPFRTDYVAWAENIAELSVQYDVLKGWVIDDFNNGSNPKTFTTEYMQEITAATDAINPELKLETVAYYGKGAVKESFYETFAPFIDGVVFPFRDEPNHNTRRASTLGRQLDAVHDWTDRYDLDLNVLFYTGRYGTFDAPKSSYVDELMAIAQDYAEQGKIQGVVSYGTPHRHAPSVNSENQAMYGNGRLALHTFAGAPDTGDFGSATQKISIDPKAERHTLNFWIQNQFFGKQAKGQRFAEVLVNDEVVWSKDIVSNYSGDKDGRWRQAEGPIEIDSVLPDGARSATLTFRVRQEASASVHTVTAFDTLQTSGIEVRNQDFESTDGWEFESTHGAFVPGIDVWESDRATRVFDAVANGFENF